MTALPQLVGPRDPRTIVLALLLLFRFFSLGFFVAKPRGNLAGQSIAPLDAGLVTFAADDREKHYSGNDRELPEPPPQDFLSNGLIVSFGLSLLCFMLSYNGCYFLFVHGLLLIIVELLRPRLSRFRCNTICSAL